MRAKEQLLTADNIRSLVSYDPETGRISRLKRRSNRGDPANAGGLTDTGYIKVNLCTERGNVLILAHRLAWIYHYGYWPPEFVDHINGDTVDNRITKLRLATITQNQYNRGIAKHNQCGIKGVTWSKSRRLWIARMSHKGKSITIGGFPTRKEAHAAYVAKASSIHGEFFHP